MLTLDALTAADMEQIRVWRHGVRETLRTPYLLTAEMQRDYYERVICNRDSRTRYWALRTETVMRWEGITIEETRRENVFIGYGGIENIEWENGRGEISLLIAPTRRQAGYGREAVSAFLREAFDCMRLNTVYGECYTCGPWHFWERIVERRGERSAMHPQVKFWNGGYFDSYYFTFEARNGWRV